MRRKIVAGNWKMNLVAHEAAELFNEIQFYCNENRPNCEVCVFPSSIYLAALNGNAQAVKVGSQNASDQAKGAYTGEISVNQLHSIGVKMSLVGHSERRTLFGESDDLLNRKIKLLIQNEFEPVFCIGETLEQREAEGHFDIIENQITKGLSEISRAQISDIVIAYEPVWAIGTGKTASPEQAQEMHAYIRSVLSDLYDKEIAENTPILYGGSVKPGNAKDIFGKEDVDGGLVGGASLNANDFISIIQAFD